MWRWSYSKKLIHLFGLLIVMLLENLPLAIVISLYSLIFESIWSWLCTWTPRKISRFEFFKKLYDNMKQVSDFGTYWTSPFKQNVIVTAPHLVEMVSKKKFSYFSSRPRSSDFGNDLTNSIFNLNGERWETTRKRLSLAFSNEKLEAMFPQMNNCAEDMSRTLLHARINYETNVNEISRKFVLKVLLCCAFGIDDMDSSSEFAKMADEFRHSDSFRLKFSRIFSYDWRHIFGGQTRAEVVSAYFKRLINERIREKKRGHDFLTSFLDFEQMENSNESCKWDRNATEAHTVVFLLGGFTATSSTIAFTLYELAKNPDIQRQMVEEIDSFLGKGDTVTPEIMRKMTYLDSIIKETLRYYPPFSTNIRICSKRFEMPTGRGKFTVEKGRTVIIPVSGLHHDPKYYPNPEVFDPSRFQNGKSPISPCTYLPFGEGPRQCVGQRFALIMIKTGIIKLVSEFQWSLVPGNEVLSFQLRKFTTSVSKITLRYEPRH